MTKNKFELLLQLMGDHELLTLSSLFTVSENRVCPGVSETVYGSNLNLKPSFSWILSFLNIKFLRSI